jgi:exopolyphosphatase / guanosine-5'-triphosphate,3'-diphosphate pyrophosphatase
VHVSIDVGSNTVRLLIAEFEQNQLNPLHYGRVITRLGGQYASDKGLASDAMERTLVALESFAVQLQGLRISSLRVVGTEVVRKAGNRHLFKAEVKRRCGFDLEVISGEEEARLSALGALAVLKPCPDQTLIFDLGGGSLELILHSYGKVLWRHSQPLGVVALAEQYPDAQFRTPVIAYHFLQIQDLLRHAGLIQQIVDDQVQLVGTAGTATTLAAIVMGMDVYRGELINNTGLCYEQLLELQSSLVTMSLAERRQVKGLESGREDLILPGLEIILRIMKMCHKDHFRVCDFGLLEGVILERFSRSHIDSKSGNLP